MLSIFPTNATQAVLFHNIALELLQKFVGVSTGTFTKLLSMILQDSIQILPGFYDFIAILLRFYRDSITILSRFY